ncbi:hypothetical protein SUGI_1060230 [Cryptomeria japonica]|nr:hypothetical protein SUGI_1060230 [Cryptomeria japonica]
MPFRGRIKQERWSRILNKMDDLASRAMKEIMREETINYDFRFKVNWDIPATFVAILLVMKIPKSEVVQLCKEVFKRDLLKGLETAIQNVDKNLMIPYMEDYEDLRGSRLLGLDRMVPRRLIMVLKNK